MSVRCGSRGSTSLVFVSSISECPWISVPSFSPFLRHCNRHRRHSLSYSAMNFSSILVSRRKLPLFRIRAGLERRPKASDLTSQLELEKPGFSRKGHKSPNVVFWILLLNIGVFVADHLLKFPSIKYLYLYHDLPRWYQFFTATFCHVNWHHLSSNLFFLYIFGKLVEEEEGGFALWLSYLATGAGANFVSWFILPRSLVSVGASGAVFGLFAISVLVKISLDWRKILEVVILGQFVIEKVMEAAQASVQFVGNGRYYAVQNVNHLAHFSGALIGVGLIWLLSQIPSRKTKDELQK
eukprot:TRINITY_DN31662_c0_g1_i1.p1 TRINITY_DN31662_c0_g1~~TRINITY_DN31662_c0_g1_i1.p1  ORF type:complete len:296 (+),score=28.47 TRINITY_DN31662_c0_g1_i1:172-1059(+)